MKQKLEELINNKASSFEVAKFFRQEIKNYLNSLDIVFEESGGKDFFVKHTKKIDEFLILLYKFILRDIFKEYIPLSNSIPISIIALGSYGREQLCIYSDIDLMILYDDVEGFNLKEIIERYITLIWDSGLKLGHRVHKISDIEKEVLKDITIKTAIIESRFIYGSKYLWYKFENRLKNIRENNQKEFIFEKIKEHNNRLNKYPLSMQPNIKDGYGGLRETNTLFWIANTIYGVKNLKELIGVLFAEEFYKEYRASLEYIFRVRNALHLIAKKKQDKIVFDIIPDITKKLGFDNEYSFFSKLFESMHKIHFFTSIVTKKIIRKFLYKEENIIYLKNNRVNKNIYLCNNKLYTSFFSKPKSLNIILKDIINLDIDSFDESFIYYLSRAKKVSLSNGFKKTIRRLFSKEKLYPIMKALYDSGMFLEVIFVAKKILNQPQFDGYHIHPVDIHSLNALRFTENIEDKFILNLYNSFSKKEKIAVKLSALFHDIGKGRGKDHHIIGAEIFKKFAKTIEFEQDIISLVERVIRYHNLLNYVATKEDIYSQKVILDFIGKIQTIETLRVLYVLTYADINSVSNNIYKSSTSILLRELFLQSLIGFENEELLKESTRKANKIKAIEKNKSFLSLDLKLQKKIISIESTQMFLELKSQDIIDIANWAYRVSEFDYKIINQDRLKIQIIRKIPLNLGFLLSKMKFLNIVYMRIFKLYDGKKFFEITFSEMVEESDILYIKEIIENSFDMDKKFEVEPIKLDYKDIQIECNHTESTALFKLETIDKKGIFAYIATIFDNFGIDIQSAKIHTHKNRVKDIILVDKNGKFCVNVDNIMDILCKR